jgi:hypothetical protein
VPYRLEKIIAQSCSDPKMVSILCRVLESAWGKIARNFGDDEAAAERTRQRLAAIVLALPVSEPPPDLESLADQALEALALGPRRGQ